MPRLLSKPSESPSQPWVKAARNSYCASTRFTVVRGLAEKAKTKLEIEANQEEHCLRRMVLTANMLDDLVDEMDRLQLQVITPADTGQRVRWADRISDDLDELEQRGDRSSDEDEDDSDASSESSDESDEAKTPPPLTRVQFVTRLDNLVANAKTIAGESAEGIVDADLESTELALKRFPSRLSNDKGKKPTHDTSMHPREPMSAPPKPNIAIRT